MKYLMLVYSEENCYSEGEREACVAESVQLTHDLNAKGQYLGASPLHPVATATSVRIRDGKRLVTDGPFAETREQLGGYSSSTPRTSTTRSTSPAASQRKGPSRQPVFEQGLAAREKILAQIERYCEAPRTGLGRGAGIR